MGKTLTLRADAETVTVWYGTHRVARHPRGWRKGEALTSPAHAEGLAAHTPRAQHHRQGHAVDQLGESARHSLQLIRAGTRSLRAELDHLLLLTTLYGPAAVEAALGALLAQAIVGSEHVEQWLKLQQAGPVAPPPLTLRDARLSVPAPRPNLARYAALLLAADSAPPAEEDRDDAPDA